MKTFKTEPTFTAKQIADALGKSRQAVNDYFDRRPECVPDATLEVSGNWARAWKIETLPRDLVNELLTAATAGGFDDVGSLLAAIGYRANIHAMPSPLPNATLYMASGDLIGKLVRADGRSRTMVFSSIYQAVDWAVVNHAHFVLVNRG